MLMRKSRVYVETSVWNFLLAEDVADRRVAAKSFFNNCEKFDFFIGELVMEEILKAPETIKKQLVKLIEETKPIQLQLDREIISLADYYVERKIIPVKFRNDAFHIAYATFYDLEYLVSYNFRHIVKVKTKDEIKTANLLRGYRTPTITIPEELIEYEE
jgi:predicted nucleic acid-binding protein